MAWFGYALLGITIWSATAVADRFFLTRHVVSRRFYVVVPALLQFPVVIFLALFFSVPHANPLAAISAVMSGAMEVVTLYYLYLAVSNEEVSRVFSLTAVGPIFTLALGWLFLRETLTAHQTIAFILFLLGGFLLATKFDASRAAMSTAIRPLVIGSLFSAAFTLLLRYAFVASDFWTGFFYSRLGFFIGGIVVLALYREEITKQWSALRARTRRAVLGNQLISLSGHAFYFLALSLASAALVQSFMGIQGAIVFFFAVVVSLWRKDAIQESVRPRDLIQKACGVSLAIAAGYFLTL